MKYERQNLSSITVAMIARRRLDACMTVLQLALPKIKFSSMSITWIRGSTLLRQSRQSVGACDVLIAVIGRRWLISFEAEGSRRLDNPDDFVRLEIATGAQA